MNQSENFKVEGTETFRCNWRKGLPRTLKTYPQAEDRQYRVGTQAYNVRVFNNEAHSDYTVIATTQLDARVLAFALDGGVIDNPMEQGHIDLALTWTEILERKP